MARSATGPSPLLATAAGVVVGAIGVVGLAAAGWPAHDAPRAPRARESVVAARRFLAAWERSRLGTWAVEARFERVTAGGRRLETDVHMAQRPPDRLIAGLGAIDARRGGERLACAPDETGVVQCRSGDPAPPYDEDVADEIRILGTYVLGPGAFYAVREEGTCFRLRLRLQVLSPPYGERARFCFDPTTGAPSRSEIERVQARDRTVAISVRGRVSEADLDPEQLQSR